jgi:hypothetical protein
MAVGNWTGATITFGTSGFVARIRQNLGWSGISRAVINRTTYASTQPTSARQVGGMESMPGKLVEPGELALEVEWDPTVAMPLLSTSIAETITLTPPSGVASNPITGSGYVSAVGSIAMPQEDIAVAQITVKWTGIVTLPST